LEIFFIVVDAGGGTIDISVLQVDDNSGFKLLINLYENSLIGSKYLDDRFWEIIEIKYPEARNVERYIKFDQMLEWEKEKCNLENLNESITVKLTQLFKMNINTKDEIVELNTNDLQKIWNPTLNGSKDMIQKHKNMIEKNGKKVIIHHINRRFIKFKHIRTIH